MQLYALTSVSSMSLFTTQSAACVCLRVKSTSGLHPVHTSQSQISKDSVNGYSKKLDLERIRIEP